MAQPGSGERRRLRDDVRVWLFAVVLAVGIPLVTVQAVLLVALDTATRTREQENVNATARLVALRLEDLTTELRTAIAMARRVARPSPELAAANDRALAEVASATPGYITSLSIYSTEGRNLGHSRGFATDSARRSVLVTDRRYFNEAVRREGLAIGEPVTGRLTGVQTVGAAIAERGADGRVRYVLATTTLIDRLRELLRVPSLPDGASVRLIDSTQALVAATDLPADSVVVGRAATPSDTERVLVGRADVAGSPWHVVVERPAASVLGPVRDRFRDLLLTAFAVLVAAGLVAMFIADRIASPLLRLGQSAKAFTRAPDTPPAAVTGGPGVVRELSADFHEMAQLISRRTAQLERSEQQYRLVTDGLPMLIGFVDPATNVRFLNGPGAAFVGRSPDETLGVPLLSLLGLGADDALAGALREALGGKATETEFRLTRADGRTSEVTSSCVPHRGASGGVEGAFVIITDVTASRRLEAQLRQAQRMDAIGRLAGGIAHDFNNLLTVILANLEFSIESARGIPGGDAITADLLAAREASERASSLTKQLLTYSRQQAGHREPVDLNAVASSGERMLRRLIGERVTMHLRLAPDLWPVRADLSQLEQVLVNLVVNARDAMPHGGDLTIETSNVELDEAYAGSHAQVAAGEYACLEITDTGTGIAEDVLPMIFEPFFTTKGVGEGTGLGLAVCYGIVQQHGGAISAYSRVGKGTTFKVLLPRSSEPLSGPSRVPNAEARGGTESVLLVEDDDAVRDTARRALTERGYAVLLASNGQEALDLVAGAHPPIDLLVTDFVMPGITGAELAGELQRRLPGLRVLLVSGYARTGSRTAAGIPESVPYLAKPYTARTLAAKVREVLDAPAG